MGDKSPKSKERGQKQKDTSKAKAAATAQAKQDMTHEFARRLMSRNVHKVILPGDRIRECVTLCVSVWSA